MSASPVSGEEPSECPLCMEPLEIDDVHFFPCTCGYQICRFCWHRIRTDENGLCPACRKPYSENPAVYKPLSTEELQRIKSEKKQKQNERKHKLSENRKHLGSVRVVQRNLVFVVGLSQRLADHEVLKRPEYFGKFGKIHKVVVNNSTSYAGSQGPSASAYITYVRWEDALRAIQAVNNVQADGRTLKASLGTTKYCSYFLKSAQCPKPDCMYLHELGDEAASFTKEDMQAGKHQDYEQKLLSDLAKSGPAAPPATTNSSLLPPNAAPPPSCDKNGRGRQTGTFRPGSSNKENWPSLANPGSLASENGIGGEGSPSSTPSPDLSPEMHTTTEHRPPDNHTTDAQSNHQSSSSPTQSGSGNSADLDGGISLTPSPPPGLPSPRPAFDPVPGGVSAGIGLGLGGPESSQSLFSSSSNPFRHRLVGMGLPLPDLVPHTPDWLGAPSLSEPMPEAPFTSETIPVSSATDWQAAFGFGSSKTQDDDLGFDPFDVTSKALADLMEKELSLSCPPLTVSSVTAHGPPGFHNHHLHNRHAYAHANGLLGGHANGLLPAANGVAFVPARGYAARPSAALPLGFPLWNPARLAHHPHGAPGRQPPSPTASQPPTSSAASVPAYGVEPSLAARHGPGTDTDGASSDSHKEWQDSLRALLPNVNISFGGLPPGLPHGSNLPQPPGPHTAGTASGPGAAKVEPMWPGDNGWMDPAIITGIPACGGLVPECLDESPPHWLKSLQALTEQDCPLSPPPAPRTTGAPPPHYLTHTNPAAHAGMLRPGWGAVHPHANMAPFAGLGPLSRRTPPPGFQPALGPTNKPPADFLQSLATNQH
ncbi:CCR4-NOT transcription complex subunit 4 isoform X1 [Lampetra fluviatilis]